MGDLLRIRCFAIQSMLQVKRQRFLGGKVSTSMMCQEILHICFVQLFPLAFSAHDTDSVVIQTLF